MTATSTPELRVEEAATNTTEVLEKRIALLEKRLEQVPDPDSLNLLIFSGDRDRLLAALVLATGAAACGMNVSMFFTFWATLALRDGGPQIGKKSIVERAFGWMLPRSAARTPLSQMDMCGMGRFLMTREMQKKNIADVDELFATAGELGVKVRVCEMSMQLMGIRREELIDYPNLDYCGVATFAEQTSQSNTTLFI